ncbi:uncharacterized protein [Nicotiana sylvestris]|uniref:uncharacterized protein n=1 Tax=Nicotiana sylvestris TaxID=4096 RepID=UPI00388C674E
MDGQSECTIHILEDMLCACVIDFGGLWDQFLPLAKFAYNNSYQSSIQIAPYEALYGRWCRSPVGWFEPVKVRILGIYLVQDALDKVKLIQEWLRIAQSKQKSYNDRKVRDVSYMVGEKVLLKHIGDLAHVLDFSMVQLDGDLTCDIKPVTISEWQFQKLRSKDITSVKVQWRGQPVEQAIWETEQEMRSRYPCLFMATYRFLDPFEDECLFKMGKM